MNPRQNAYTPRPVTLPKRRLALMDDAALTAALGRVKGHCSRAARNAQTIEGWKQGLSADWPDSEQ